MPNPLIPLQSRATQPRLSYPEAQAQQITLESLRNKGQMEALALKQQQQQIQDQQKIRQILASGLPDDQTIAQLKQNGLPDVAFAFQKSLDDRNKAIADSSREQRLQHEQDLKQTSDFLYGLRQLPEGSPERASAWYKYRSSHPAAKDMPDVMSNSDIDLINARMPSTLDQIKIQNELDAGTKPTALGQGFTGEGNQRIQPYVQKNPATGAFEIKTQNLGAIEPPKTTISALTPQTITVNGKGPVAALRDPQGNYVDATTKQPIQGQIGVYERPREGEAGTGDAAVDLSPAALDVAARRYLQDGTLPPMGMGVKASGARSRILNRAAQIDPQAAIAANKAEYDANKAVLTQLQKNSSAVSAFEQTAKKNLEQFIETAKKVRDTGSPWINRGLRTVDRKLLGKTEQAAYDAARQVAFVELARVVSNPNLVGVLSDSARKEMEGILSGDATLAQTLRTSEVLLQDMQNRKGGIDDQIKVIQDRLKNPEGTSKAGIVIDPAGVEHQVSDVEAAIKLHPGTRRK